MKCGECSRRAPCFTADQNRCSNPLAFPYACSPVRFLFFPLSIPPTPRLTTGLSISTVSGEAAPESEYVG